MGTDEAKLLKSMDPVPIRGRKSGRITLFPYFKGQPADPGQRFLRLQFGDDAGQNLLDILVKRLPFQVKGLIQEVKLDADEPKEGDCDQNQDEQDDRFSRFHASSLQRSGAKIPNFNII